MRITELDIWKVQACDTNSVIAPADVFYTASHAAGDVYASEQTIQVHDLLREKGVISGESIETGDASGCQWVGQSDWVYRTSFNAPSGLGPHFLHCAGLDTVCDLFLNGTHIGSSRSMYLPFRADITELLKPQNELLIYFHRHTKVLDYYESSMPAEWRGNIPAGAMLRRMDDYGCRPADCHGYKPIGPFDKVLLESVDRAELLHADIEVALNAALNGATVTVGLEGKAYDGAVLSAQVVLSEADGSSPVKACADILSSGCVWKTELNIYIDHPKLWWPKNYGEHPLYKAEIELLADGLAVSRVTKQFGVRKIRVTGNMKFECNDVPIRLWGGNLAPIWGPSNTFNPGYTFELVEKIGFWGANVLRVWGPSQPYPDEFYDRLDQLGILLWQDFPTNGSQLPDSDEYKALLYSEAAHMVRRLKHHPCILLWCGGNENIYMCEARGENGTHGFDILTGGYRAVCAELDPQRYYHPDCPYGGRYVNDPLVGDSHGSRALRSYCPGEAYGAFFSENIRVYPPQYKSFYRWLGESVWEDDYVDIKPFGRLKAMPSSWQRLVGNNGEEKFGPIWDYYSATSVHELIYKYTSAAGQDLYQMFARSRRGNPAYKSHEEQFCRGHMLWKINDPWPNFYCAVLDYYLEPSLPYYAVKRAISPVWIDFEVADHIYLWGVNDAREPVDATLELTLYNLEHEEIKNTLSLPAALHPGTSRILMDLDSFGFLHWFTLLHARLKDRNGDIIAVTNNYVTKENMLPFHDAKLNLELNGDALVITTDKFARCVELSAGDDGCAFGWMFEDNFFDLFPFETKEVKIQKRGAGNIRAKAQYSPHITKITL